MSYSTANWSAVIAAASCSCLLAYMAYTILYRRTGFHTLRGPPNPSLWLGHLKEQQSSEPGLLYERWIAEYGPVLRMMGPLNSCELLTTDLRAITHVLHHADIYEKPPTVRKALSHVLGWGVLVTEGEQHRLQRKALNPAFGAGQVRELTGIFIDKANELRNQWFHLLEYQGTGEKAGHRLDALRWYSRATLDIIGLAGFGYSFNSLSAAPGSEDEMYIAFRNLFGKPGSTMLQMLSLFFPILRSLPLAKNHEIKEAMAVMRRVGHQLIVERKAAAILEAAQGEKIEHSRARDILTLLVRANTSANPKERLTDEEVLAQIPTFLVAGHETTSTLMSWITYRLSFNPEIQSQLREECQANPLPTDIHGNAPLTSEELALLDKLPLLDAVVRETLRLHAPIAETSRQATHDDVIPVSSPYLDAQGVEQNRIPVAKGDSISIPALLIHRLPELWGADANEWKPERWMNQSGIPAVAKAIPGLYSNTLAFLGGSHACIGWKFSLYETKILLHVLVSSFVFQLAVSPDDIGGKPGIVTRPYIKSLTNGGAQMPIIISKVLEDVAI